jgi:hypothetical protein
MLHYHWASTPLVLAWCWIWYILYSTKKIFDVVILCFHFPISIFNPLIFSSKGFIQKYWECCWYSFCAVISVQYCSLSSFVNWNLFVCLSSPWCLACILNFLVCQTVFHRLESCKAVFFYVLFFVVVFGRSFHFLDYFLVRLLISSQ